MKTTLPKIILAIVITIAVAGSVWFFSQNLSSNNSTSNNVNTNSSSNTANSPSASNSQSGLNTSSSPATSEKTSNSISCIVTISGQKYDVTELLKTHPGGNIFQCGKDNTSIFFSKHDQKWLDSRVAKYKVN